MAAPLSIYTTRSSIENAGIPTTTWSNARLNELIVQISSFVDEVCAGSFIPYADTILLSGDDRPIIMRPDLLPILSVSDLQVIWGSSNGRGRVFQGILGDITLPPRARPFTAAAFDSVATFTDSEYKLKLQPLPRWIEAIRSVFPGGVQNVRITGVFGWPELTSIKATAFSTTTTTDLTPTSTSVTLTSVTGLKLRDVILVGTDQHPVITQAVDTGTKVVTIDAPAGLLTSTIAAGATAVSFGATPRGIQRAVNFLAMREVIRQAQWASGNFVDPSLIAGEQVDKYSWKAFSPSNTIGFGKAPGLTSVTEIDEILMHFVAPVMIDFA